MCPVGGAADARRQQPQVSGLDPRRQIWLSSSLLNRHRAARLLHSPASAVPQRAGAGPVVELPVQPRPSAWESAEADRQFLSRFVTPARERRPDSTHLCDLFPADPRRLPTVVDEDGDVIPVSLWDLSELRQVSSELKKRGMNARGQRRPLSAVSYRRCTPHNRSRASAQAAPSPIQGPLSVSNALAESSVSAASPSPSQAADELLQSLFTNDSLLSQSAEDAAGHDADRTHLPCGHVAAERSTSTAPPPKSARPQYMQATTAARRRRTARHSTRGDEQQQQAKRRGPPPRLVSEEDALSGTVAAAVVADAGEGSQLFVVSAQPRLGTSMVGINITRGGPPTRPPNAPAIPGTCRGLVALRHRLYLLLINQGDQLGSVVEYDPSSRERRLLRSHKSLARAAHLCGDGSRLYYCCCYTARPSVSRSQTASRLSTVGGPGLSAATEPLSSFCSAAAWRPGLTEPAASTCCGGLFCLEVEASSTERRLPVARPDSRLQRASAMAACGGKLYIAVPAVHGDAGGLGSCLLEYDRQHGGQFREVSDRLGEVAALTSAAGRLYVAIGPNAPQPGLWEADPQSGALERRLDTAAGQRGDVLALCVHDGRLYAAFGGQGQGSAWEWTVRAAPGAGARAARVEKLPFSYEVWLSLLAAYERCGADPSKPLSAKSDSAGNSELRAVLDEIARTTHLSADPEELKQLQRERKLKCDFGEVLRLLFPGRTAMDLRKARVEHQREREERERTEQRARRERDWRGRVRERWPGDERRAEREIAEREQLFDYLAGSSSREYISVPAQPAADVASTFGLELAGQVVRKTHPGGLAERAGVGPGCQLDSINGEIAYDASHMDDLFASYRKADKIWAVFSTPPTTTQAVTADDVMARLPRSAVLSRADVVEVLRSVSRDGVLTIEELAQLFDQGAGRDGQSGATPDLYFQADSSGGWRDDPAVRLDCLLDPTLLDPATGRPVRAGPLERAAKPRIASPSEPTLVPLPDYVSTCRVCRKQQQQQVQQQQQQQLHQLQQQQLLASKEFAQSQSQQ